MASDRDEISAGDGDAAQSIARREFNQVRRGYEPSEVRRFLADISDDMARLRTRTDDLAAQLAEAKERAANPVVSEEAVVAAVGDEMATILRSAHGAASDLKTRAAEEAERVVGEARARAATINADADDRLASAETEIAERLAAVADEVDQRLGRARTDGDAIVASAREEVAAEVAQIVARARTDADLVRQQADQDRRLTVEGAQAIRERILADLARRRRVATVQIEQLRAGRERLLESYGVVRRTLEEVHDELQRADSEARAAADEAGRRLGAEAVDPGPEETEPGSAVTETGVSAPGEASTDPTDPTEPTEPGETSTGETRHGETRPGETLPGESLAAEATSTHQTGSAQTGSAETVPAETVPAETVPAETVPAETRIAETIPGETLGGETLPGETLAGETLAGEGTDAPSDPTPAGRTGTKPAVRDRVPSGLVAGGAGVGSGAGSGATAVGADVQRGGGAARRRVRLLPRGERDEPPVAGARTGAVTAGPSTGAGHLHVMTSGNAAVALDARLQEPIVAPDQDVDAVEEGDDAVDSLFERIRAGRQRSVAEARRVLGAPLEPAPGSPAELDPKPETELETEPEAHPETRTVAEEAAAGDGAVAGRAEGQNDRAVDAGIIRSDSDESELQRRDAELDELVSGLITRLKRVLQDEHNDLLDRLRSQRGAPTGAALLAPADEQVERYVAAARPFLEAAAAAGVRSVTVARPDGDPDPEVDVIVATVVAPAVELVVRALIEPLRSRVESVVVERGGDASEVLIDALASVYRATRSHRLPPLAADVLSAAHAEATWRAAPEGAALRWIAEDAGGPCPDCDDNALEGGVRKGDVYPTGQLHPPAHIGCRCLLVVESD